MQGANTGRPKSDINPAEVKFLMAKGFSKSNISSLLDVSWKNLHNRLKTWDPATFSKYTAMNDAELDDKVREIKSIHSNDGEVMMAGHLKSRGTFVTRTNCGPAYIE